MNKLTRRDFIKFSGSLGAYSACAGLVSSLSACASKEKKLARVVIIGGGFGGASCAKYLHRFAPDVDITLIERDKQYITCPFSNMVLGGIRDMASITHGYNKLASSYAINIMHDAVTAIDPVAKTVTTAGSGSVQYDRLVVSPGIGFRWDQIEGYDATISQRVAHAWKAGPQTALLRKQLMAMDDGGTVIVAPPANPFRCPPGPYERVSMMAHYLTHNKPKSKILILDAKDKFSKQPLFMQGWDALYPGMIEWVKGTAGGIVSGIDVKTNELVNELGDRFKGDVINLIPPQKAGVLAHIAGLVDKTGWCPVNQRTFESKIHQHVHVIGDACIAGKMPKSGFAANSQGKVCAAAIAASLGGYDMPDPSYVNTCYSLVAPDYGISVAAVYKVSNETIVKVEGSGGVSPKDADAIFRQQEAVYGAGWYDSITSDMFT